MQANPYAKYLDGREPLAIIQSTEERLKTITDRLGRARWETEPAPGKWSARDILAHLADTELVFAFRLRQSIAEDHHTIQPFDQDKWAATYTNYDLTSALAVFGAVRDWNIRFIRDLPRASLSKRLTHPERGEMDFATLIETMAGHDLNHIAQLERILGEPA